MSNKTLKGVVVLFGIISLGLGVGSLTAPVWVRFDLDGETNNWGLYTWQDCAYTEDQGNTWNCWKENDTTARRDTGEKMHLATQIFIAFHSLALVSILLTLQFFVKIWSTGAQSCCKFLHTVVIIIAPVAELLAVLSWSVLSEAQFSSCDSENYLKRDENDNILSISNQKDDLIDLCAGSGPIIAICNIIVLWIYSGVAIALLFCTKQKVAERYLDVQQTGISGMCSYNVFIYLSVIFMSVGLFLGLIEVLTADWITWEDESNKYEGSLFTVDDYADMEHADWSCLAGPACDADIHDQRWVVLSGLQDGAHLYLIFEVISLVACLLSISNIIEKICQYHFGSPLILHLVYVLAPIAHFIAIIVWLVESNATYSDCGEEIGSTGVKQYPCMEGHVGLAMATVQLLVLIAGSVFFGCASGVEVYLPYHEKLEQFEFEFED